MMKIHWFSPLPPARTDIANYTARLAPHLAAHAEVVFCHDQAETPEDFPYPVRAICDLSPTELNQADLNIYHIGNNADFHGAIWSTAQRHPGLVVLHDFAVHEFVCGMLNVSGNRDTPQQGQHYIRLMTALYGDAGYQAALAVNAGRLSPAVAAEQFPLCEAVADGALAILTHNPRLESDLRQRLPLLPVHSLPLPYPAPATPAPAERAAGTSLRLISFGFTGPNRRLLEFIDAWAASPVRAKIQLDICGELWDPALVRQKLAEHGLTGQANLHGFVSAHTLDSLLDQAHLALNLRYPSMGEASGSQLRIWSRALASVVTDTGWYAGLPDECVFKIRPDHEAEDLCRLLQRLVAQPEQVQQVGAAGARQLAVHAPEHYAHRLIGLCAAERQEWHLRWLAGQMARRAGVLMAEIVNGQALVPGAVGDLFQH